MEARKVTVTLDLLVRDDLPNNMLSDKLFDFLQDSGLKATGYYLEDIRVDDRDGDVTPEEIEAAL